jgi:hypothetical protein
VLNTRGTCPCLQDSQAHRRIVIAGEVCEHLAFGRRLTFGRRRLGPAAARPGMARRTVTTGSAGKMFSAWGWKM